MVSRANHAQNSLTNKATASLSSTSPASPPDSSPAHNPIKLIHLDTSRHAGAAIRLEYHILEQLLVNIFLEHSRHPAQMRQRDGSLLPIRKQAKCLVHSALVCFAGGLVFLCVELERADGEEGLVGCVSV